MTAVDIVLPSSRYAIHESQLITPPLPNLCNPTVGRANISVFGSSFLTIDLTLFHRNCCMAVDNAV
jgi:hypothetical protein